MLNVLDLFSGVGGFSLGLERTGQFRTTQFVEADPACRRVLQKHWPDVPIHDDVNTYDPGNQPFDVICGGFPCTDISFAGKGAGLEGDRSGLWYQYLRIIGQALPQWVLIENVAALRQRGLPKVLHGLAEIGYHARWDCIPASAVGAAHSRDRIWIIANPSRKRVEGLWSEGFKVPQPLDQAFLPDGNGQRQWQVEPDLAKSVYGLSRRVDGSMKATLPGRSNSWMDEVKQMGNAVVPAIPHAIGAEILRVEALS
jgi:DNA (cytosine-5)-methyltransferase 1